MDLDYRLADRIDDPFVFVPVVAKHAETAVPELHRDAILVDTVHDGDLIPRKYLERDGRAVLPKNVVQSAFARERDWGADLVAEHLARWLGLAGYHRVAVARVLLDFNRFPGTTPPGADDPLGRLSINPPFAAALTHPEKMSLLEEVYDGISDRMERALAGKLIRLGIHTYDEHNPNLTRRPTVSLITRPASYQQNSRMPFGVFDPMYPDELGESTCSRTLRDRISLNLERAGFRVGHNHPYLLPEGCIDVRSQVWVFFLYLRRRFELERPETREDPAFRRVWTMLLNTNLRLAEAESLRGFLHRYRRVGADVLPAFQAAQRAYEEVREFVSQSRVVTDFRRSHHRPSSLVIEVRKDVVAELDPETRLPLRLIPENASRIAKVIAGAVTTFLTTDRQVPEEGISGRLPALSPDAQRGWV
ncbi:MAG: hypothetical protein D6731_25730 [Planctomycetota bacterium]|nr:MAG: hypothetical protein D6731_25730 [Planctomycetota bacterium]